jgi:ribosomal protein S18 acetylase RimI-like enzyme
MPASRKHPAPVIRDAETADVPVLVDFLTKLALHVSGAPPQDLKASERKRLGQALRTTLESPNKKVVVAEAPGFGLVGMGDISIWTSQGIWEQAHDIEYRSGIIDDIWVEPDFRSLGIFRALLRELVNFAELRGAQELILEYSASNKEANAAWTKLGFKTTGLRAAAFTHHVKEELA